MFGLLIYWWIFIIILMNTFFMKRIWMIVRSQNISINFQILRYIFRVCKFNCSLRQTNDYTFFCSFLSSPHLISKAIYMFLYTISQTTWPWFRSTSNVYVGAVNFQPSCSNIPHILFLSFYILGKDLETKEATIGN